MRPIRRSQAILLLAVVGPCLASDLTFNIHVETVMEHDDGAFLWYHPRASAVGVAGCSNTSVVMTLQKHLNVSDYYSGLFMMRRPQMDGAWIGPLAIPELDWRPQPGGTTVSVADVTPGWHAASGKLLAIGCEVPYSSRGEQLDDQPRQHQTAYAVFDPATDHWTEWRQLKVPRRFAFCRSACSQWLVRPDGALLVPVYFGDDAKGPWSVTVMACRFDGDRLTYQRHGTELTLNIERGLVEPSIAFYRERYYLTIRNDERGYVTTSPDGLRWGPLKSWTFDDGTDLGSYNTQQHWVVHSDGLFLVYTRRGATNDHIMRHRAPLFIAPVDPIQCEVIRTGERTLIPERGAELGNFGASTMNTRESWVTVSEGLWNKEARGRGGRGATFVARILWSKPNRLALFE